MINGQLEYIILRNSQRMPMPSDKASVVPWYWSRTPLRSTLNRIFFLDYVFDFFSTCCWMDRSRKLPTSGYWYKTLHQWKWSISVRKGLFWFHSKEMRNRKLFCFHSFIFFHHLCYPTKIIQIFQLPLNSVPFFLFIRTRSMMNRRLCSGHHTFVWIVAFRRTENLQFTRLLFLTTLVGMSTVDIRKYLFIFRLHEIFYVSLDHLR